MLAQALLYTFMMFKFILTVAILSAFSLQAAADSVWEEQGPSVWEQQEAPEIYARIRDVQLKGFKVTFQRLEEGASPSVQTMRLCTTDSAVDSGNATEADRAMAIHLRVDALRSAKRANEVIKLGLLGTWNGCVYPVSI
jgi:hypothetical protein